MACDRPGRLQVAQKITEAIKWLPYLITVSEMRSFLGLCNVYRGHVPNFAKLFLPLSQKLKKEAPRPFELGDTVRDAVSLLKNKTRHATHLRSTTT